MAMDELLEDCAPEGTATPVFTERIARDARRGRLRRWLGRLLALGRGRANARRSVVAPEALDQDGDGAWANLDFLQPQPAGLTPSRARRLDRKRVTAGRERLPRA